MESEKLRCREQMIHYENNLDSSKDSIHQYEEYDDWSNEQIIKKYKNKFIFLFLYLINFNNNFFLF